MAAKEDSPAVTDRVRWRVPLPVADAGELIALPDGGCLVASRHFLATVRPTGELAWLVETGPGWPGSPVLLPDGRVARHETDRLTVRDGENAAVLWSWPEVTLAGLAASPDGDLLYGRWAEGRGAELCKVGPDGMPRWSRSLSGRLRHAPTVSDQRILVGDGSLLRAYDLDGTLLWTADQDGFHLADAVDPRTPAKPDRDTVAGPVMVLDDNFIVVELRRYASAGLYLFDLQSATVDKLRPPVAVHPPLAALHRPGQAPALAALGPTERGTASTWQWTVVTVDTSSRVEWTARSPAEPRLLLSDQSGHLYLVTSPDLDRWRRYHDWYDLSRECAIRCLDASGHEQWTWYAPHPLTYRPAISPTGEMFAGGPGTLFALRSEA